MRNTITIKVPNLPGIRGLLEGVMLTCDQQIEVAAENMGPDDDYIPTADAWLLKQAVGFALERTGRPAL